MIDKICKFLLRKIRIKMPEIDDNRAEVIQYGLELLVGEVPKAMFMFVLGAALGLWWQTLLSFFLILPYKIVSGGFHLKTHLGCFIGTNICYCGNAILSTYFRFDNITLKYLVIGITFVLSLIFITKYAPADTINLPILTKKERRIKKSLSYLFLSINVLLVINVSNEIISNILLFGTIIQSFSITRFAYFLTKNEYGHEAYFNERVLE